MPVDVLVVEDDADMCRLLTSFVEEIGYGAQGVGNGEDAIALYGQLHPALVILDMKLPDTDGLSVLRELKEIDPTCRVIILSSYSAAPAVVDAMKLGAENYLTKPTPLPELQVLIDGLLARPLQEDAERPSELEGVIGQSPAMQDVFAMVRRVAGTQATVLIRGESGTGKEVIARAVHMRSLISGGPFVTVDCANIPANLMETELFGHERGAFTDAKSLKKGLVEAADGGTLFLDEIGLMPLDLQAKMLGILETRRFRRVGGTEERDASVRFLAATNENLESLVEEGRFRKDLYYRLNVVPIDLPPLREREEDVILIAEHYLELFTSLHGIPPRRLGEDAWDLLRSYELPGNVRELKNVIERAVLMTDRNVICASDLIIDRRSRSAIAEHKHVAIHANGANSEVSIDFPPEGVAFDTIEREVIRAALEEGGGNITRTASLLKISRDALRYRMNKHGVQAIRKEAG